MKDEIEYLIIRGYLNRFVKQSDARNDRNNHDNRNDRNDKQKKEGNSQKGSFKQDEVSSTLSLEGNCWRNNKLLQKSLCKRGTYSKGNPPKKANIEQVISFCNKDLEGVKFSHDDLLVINMLVGNFTIRGVLIDNRSSVNVLYHDVYKKMCYINDQLTPSLAPLYGFTRIETKIEGIIASNHRDDSPTSCNDGKLFGC